MRAKTYRLRGKVSGKGKLRSIHLDLEFDGKRAFVVWDSMALGSYLLKARVEIDPGLLSASQGRGYDYVYKGELVLPVPENN